uniref:DUF38 domain-containing protein n=1 Tax=Panagrolaimus sp. JU765 TaxID=591449 RepID=A0AC34Q0C5_9BILA
MLKIQADDVVKKVDEELLDAVQKLDQLNVTIQESNKEIEIWKGMVKELLQKISEKENLVVQMVKQVEVSKKCILKIQSKKNRLLRPVQLCSTLYGDIFNTGLQFKPFEHLEKLLPLFLIGKEAKNGLVQVLKHYDQLTFTDHNICFRSLSKVIFADYSKFSTMLVQLLAPYVTKVCFDGEVPANYQRLFFENLSKNQYQRKLTIRNLKKVDGFVIEAVKKLNEKNIFVTLKYPENNVLLELPGLHFDCLKISIAKEAFFIWNNFPCTFSKLNIRFVDSRVLKDLEKVFGQLNTAYSKVQKLEISFPINCFHEPESKWNEIKQWIEDAPQQEIIVNFNYETEFKAEYEKAIASFGGVRIDGSLTRTASIEAEVMVFAKLDFSIFFSDEIPICVDVGDFKRFCKVGKTAVDSGVI